jgi:ABC-2 type transport system ATP-binding protein
VKVIVAEQLHKTYAGVPAVAGVDLVVDEGELVAVLGANGAGKTTTIEMLLGLRQPTRGEVRVLGGHPSDGAVRGRVGAMLQSSDTPSSLTVAEVVGLVCCYYPYALPVADVLARAELTDLARRRVGELSVGQNQRLSFALAIAGDPDLLFLDEPTAGLDVSARHSFWAQVRGLADLGKTVLFSTHHLDEAEQFADRVVVIHHGRIVQDATPAQITAQVAAKTVRLLTSAPPSLLAAIPGVRHVDVEATTAEERAAGLGRFTVRSASAERLLADLAAGGHTVADLTVSRTNLEQAFVHLTSGTAAVEVAA